MLYTQYDRDVDVVSKNNDLKNQTEVFLNNSAVFIGKMENNKKQKLLKMRNLLVGRSQKVGIFRILQNLN